MRTRFVIALGVSLIGLPAVARGDEWPQFRGPGGTGLTDAKQLPQEWGADKNIAWKAKVPGRGWSSPIVWGDKVFVTAADTDQAARGGRPGGGRPGGGGGFGGPPQSGQLLPPFVQDRLELTAEQKKQLEALQKDV